MMTSLDQLQTWMHAKEDEHLEFKEAKNNFHFETLVKYCVALANEGGGRMILGVTDKPPRRVVSSQAFHDLERTKAGLIERLRLRVMSRRFGIRMVVSCSFRFPLVRSACPSSMKARIGCAAVKTSFR